MNFNHKIKEFGAGGIPAYNSRLNEIIRCVNWLLGIRTTNGRPMSESSTGPIIDLTQSSSTPASINEPWLIDPNGNVAGWLPITYLDSSNNLNDVWVWSGPPFNTRACS